MSKNGKKSHSNKNKKHSKSKKKNGSPDKKKHSGSKKKHGSPGKKHSGSKKKHGSPSKKGHSGSKKNHRSPKAFDSNNNNNNKSSESSFDHNSYATKKTMTQGLFNVAVLTSNASQLKRVLVAGPDYQFYTLMIILICSSIFFQIVLGCLCIYVGIKNINHSKDRKHMDTGNNIITCLVFLVTVLNVFIDGFGFHETPQEQNNKISTLKPITTTVSEPETEHFNIQLDQ